MARTELTFMGKFSIRLPQQTCTYMDDMCGLRLQNAETIENFVHAGAPLQKPLPHILTY